MTQSFTCKQLWSSLKLYNYAIELPLQPCLCLRLRVLQDLSRNCPVVFLYVGFFTQLFVYLIVLTQMLATWEVTANMECFTLARFLDENLVLPAVWCNISKLLQCTEILATFAHLHTLHHRPVSCSTFPSFLINFTITLSVKSSWISPAISFLLLTSTTACNLCRSLSPSFCIMYVNSCPVLLLN